MRPQTFFLCFAAALQLLMADSLRAEQPGAAQNSQVDFARDVAPIFRRSCLECHGPVKQAGDLRLDGVDLESLQSVVAPRKLDESELWRRIILPRGHDKLMPAIGEPLSQAQIDIIRRWIMSGAHWPEAGSAQPHWSYVKPTRPNLPPVSDPSWIRQPIDHFVLQRLDQAGLKPSPRASAEKLVRRLYLDLIGLPPTIEEVRAFAEEPSDEELERVIDNLLNRPQFGERWARQWLDAARYADSHGFQRDNLRDMWAYRDWVIAALNHDMPFDQFSIEQLAGDLLPNATEAQKIATGFHRCSPTNVEAGSLPEETRIEQVIDRVNTTGAVWLGSTLECCQCHDHKYDPFKQSEYYQFLAFFNNTQLEADRSDPKKPSSIEFQGPALALSNPERDAQRQQVSQQLEKLKAQLKSRRHDLTKTLEAWVGETADQLSQAAQNHPLEITGFTSEGPTDSFNKLKDGSVLLVGGDPPETDIYEVHARSTVQSIRGFRLEAMRHASLPGQGPGRGDAARRNFVLNDFTAELRPQNATSDTSASSVDTPRLKFVSASASFSQKGWDVLGAVDSDGQSGWAISPQFDRAHWATFILDKPLDVPTGYELVFRLHQTWGRARTLGCFRISAVTGNVDARETIASDVVAAVTKTNEQRSQADQKLLTEYRASQDTETIKLGRAIAKLEKQLAEFAPDTTQVMVELQSRRDTAVFERGDYRKPGQTVNASTPAVLHPMIARGQDRLALARWLMASDNPLVARVTINRWWAELFGQGIVGTVEDFGIKGDLPTHPELLDWLAIELVDNDWSMKRWLKSVVLSATYQQAANISDDLHAIDPQNHLLARGPRLRMDAEMIRDNALAISGLLDPTSFGPPIRPYQPDGIWSKVGGTAYNYDVSPVGERHRRGIYVILKRGTPYPSFINFDASARQTCTLRRSRTNTPLQALTLLNDPVYVEAAEALAQRIESDQAGHSLEAKIETMFQLCTARRPTNSERSVLSELYAEQFKRSNARTSGDKSAESAAWYSMASVLLNLHETITKD